MGKGGAGGEVLAQNVLEVIDEPQSFKHLYDLDLPLEDKIETIVKEIYGGKSVSFTNKAQNNLHRLKKMAGTNIPFVWLKHNIHSQMIKHNLVRQVILKLQFVN